MDVRCKNEKNMNLHSLFLKHLLYSYWHLANVYLCLDMEILLSTNIANTSETLSQLSFLFFSFLFLPIFSFHFASTSIVCPSSRYFVRVCVYSCALVPYHSTTFEWLFQFLNCAVKLNIPYRNSFRFISVHHHYVRFLQHLWCLFLDLRVFEIDVYYKLMRRKNLHLI